MKRLRVLTLAAIALCGGAYAQQSDPALAAMYAGRAAYAEGRRTEAERHFVESIRLLRAGPRAQHGFLAYPLVGMAAIQLDEGRYGEAKRTSEEALNWAKGMFGARSEVALMALNPLGVALDGLADPSAKEVWREAVEVARALPTVNDPEARLTPLSNYAASLLDLGDPVQAEAINRTVLERRRAIYGDRPEGRFYIAASQLGLASAVARQGRVEEAEQLIRAAFVDVREAERAGEKLRTQDLATASLISLSDLLVRLKRFDDADVLLSGAIEDWRGPGPAPSSALNNLAALKFARGEQREAVELFHDVYRLRLESAWANAPGKPRIGVEARDFAAARMANADLLTSAANLARALFDTGEQREALALQRGVVEAHRVLAGDGGLAVLEARAALGGMLAAGGDAQALGILRQAYEGLTAAPEFAEARLRVGYAYGRELARTGQADEGLPLILAYTEAFSELSRSSLLTWRDARQLLNRSTGVFEDVLETSWMTRGSAS